MMRYESSLLARQINAVFKSIRQELMRLPAGVVFIHIRDSTVGKFGVRHHPIEMRENGIDYHREGMSENQWETVRDMTIEAVLNRGSWSHGEIHLDFALRQKALRASLQFESNYNMAYMRDRD